MKYLLLLISVFLMIFKLIVQDCRMFLHVLLDVVKQGSGKNSGIRELYFADLKFWIFKTEKGYQELDG